MHRGILLLSLAVILVGLVPQVRADGLMANWLLNQPANSTSFPDSGPNNLTAALTGNSVSTAIQGPFGASGPTALSFPVNSGNLSASSPTYISVPYNQNLSEVYKNGNWGGLQNLTISAWVFLPSGWGSSSPCSEIVSYYPPGTEGSTAGQVYQLGDGFSGTSHRMYFVDGLQGGTAFDRYYESNPDATPGKWQLITATYNGAGTGSNAVCTLYENGVCIQSADGTPQTGALPEALTSGIYSALYIGNGWGPNDNGWYGGLSDLGLWNICLTGGVLNTADQIVNAGTTGGQISAMYNAPTGSYAALQQYGVSAMDKLFTLYDGQLGSTTTVTTGNSTLTWKYVNSGLTGGSGVVGQLGNGQYYMQFDANGGGVETIATATPEPGTVALLASGLAGLLAYAWRKRK